MSLRTWYFASEIDGILTGESFSASKIERLEGNIPRGCVAIEGVTDWMSQRVDVKTMELVDYQPPQPDDGHDWNEVSKRWEKRADVIAAEMESEEALRRIAEIERRQQRRIRELLAAEDPALKAMDDEVAALRPKILRPLPEREPTSGDPNRVDPSVVSNVKA